MSQLIFISDTHTKHSSITNDLNVIYDQDPESILIHSGDVSYRGTLGEIKRFLTWFKDLPFKTKILIAGNHDFIFEDNPSLIKQMLFDEFPEIIYLEDCGFEVNGLKFWGSPVTPRFYDWAFNRDENIQNHWDLIPEDVNVLITHGPPYMILDRTKSGLHVGCKLLSKRISELNDLKVHAFGHIHEANGTHWDKDVVYVNSSILNLEYEVKNSPIIIKL